ncbi:hypothetical protein ACQKFE_18910 [Stutzerimonas stutzeri]|jgi:hypothetical protein|uniref:hypothetical protein n=1 Tax=Stutzerimonas stutzeri TaxID=316 RepID=UPI003CFFD05B
MKYRDGVNVELGDRVIVHSFGIPMEASVVFISSPLRTINGFEWLALKFPSECIAVRWENQGKAQKLYWPSAEAGEMADFLITDSDDEDVSFISRAIK